MRNDIILSIKPKYAEMILQGTKTVELRKSLPKEMPTRVYMYVVHPVNKIVGWFVPRMMDKIERDKAFNFKIWELAGIDHFDYCTYLGKQQYVCFFTIQATRRYDLPLPKGIRPPQNFVYLKEPCASCLCWGFPGCEACLKVKEEI